MTWTPKSEERPPEGTPQADVIKWSLSHWDTLEGRAYAEDVEAKQRAALGDNTRGGLQMPGFDIAPEPELSQSQLEEISARAGTIEESARTISARTRAYRGNMLKKIKANYHVYQTITPEDAARKTKLDETAIRLYLEQEARRQGTLISEGPVEGTFVLLTGFE